MTIETEKLFLVPLTAEQMWLWVKDIPTLEKALHCSYQAEPMKGVFLEIVKGQAEKTTADEKNYLYYTFWFIIRKLDRVVIGSADFKNIPDETGNVEIGYGLGKAFERNGYMTECVKAMCNWALKQSGISHIIAETNIENFASKNTLKRCGFQLYQQSESYWWRL